MLKSMKFEKLQNKNMTDAVEKLTIDNPPNK
jgi:hypothetical protein